MQTNTEKIKNNKFFLFSLFAVSFAVLISNFVSKYIASATTDILSVVLSGGLLVLSAFISIEFRGKGDLGKAYLLFSGFVSLWFSAEVIWLKSELVTHLLPFPEYADWLYLGGYALLVGFSIYYLKPFQIAITRKMLGFAALSTAVLLIPTLYSTYSFNPNSTIAEILWGAIYPIADAAILFPAVLGLALFVKGEVGLFWSLTCIAIILNIIADSGFFFLDIGKSDYSGNPVNILYMCAYILFAFGIHSHVKLYKKPKMKSYDNTDDLK
ncbi:MAG TPA: hypothetical protein VJ771_08530 [Candidatus Nitrosotalea sp.]|nr:hypothetical protein [Candidatus Nitrosotalea sp.]